MTNNIGNIINRTLSKEYLNNEVFKQVADSDLPFLSKSTKKCFAEYSSNGNQDNAKQLWKNLLIDAICTLKINDSREKIFLDSEKDIKILLDNWEIIRKTNTYGIDELDEYFDDFIKFETVLYGTDELYRDHVEHVLQVWGIGICLIENFQITANDDFIIKKDIDFNFQIPIDDRIKSISKSELWAMWSIISLCHDLGYPIEKTSKINRQAKKIIAHFGNINFSELNYNFDVFNIFLVDKYLNIISSKAIQGSKLIRIQTKYRDKIAKSLEDYKHGVFSGLLIFKNLTYFLETDYFYDNNILTDEDIRQFYIRKEILRSISGHTCPKIYHLALDKIAFLLILCDELQEWNRPNFDEYRSFRQLKEPQVQIKEFELSENQIIHIEFLYEEQDINQNELISATKSRFKLMHNLLRSAKDDEKRKVKFIWKVKYNKNCYSFNFDSNKDSFNQLTLLETENEQTKPFEIY
jgi:hypothetical protein